MVEDWGEAYHPNEEPAVPKFLLSSLYNAMFYSAVVLFLLLKKNARPQGRRIMGRESGVFIRRSVCILLYDLKLSKKKKKKRSRASLSLLLLFLSKLFPNLVCQHCCLVSCPHTELRVGIGKGACTHTSTQTHTHAHKHTTDKLSPSGVKFGCSTTPYSL